MNARNAVVLFAMLANTACIDFVEPVFPPSGAVLFSASADVLPDGSVNVRAHLTPGSDMNHAWRMVSPDSLRINAAPLSSSNIAADNQRDYIGSVTVDAKNSGFLRFQPPTVVGVTPPAVLALAIPQQADRDTVRFSFAAPFILHVRLPQSFAIDSATVSRTWLIEISDGAKAFRLGGDGPPPATITVPPEYQPLDKAGTTTATLLAFETRRVDQPSGDYIAVYSIATRIRWIVQTLVK